MEASARAQSSRSSRTVTAATVGLTEMAFSWKALSPVTHSSNSVYLVSCAKEHKRMVGPKRSRKGNLVSKTNDGGREISGGAYAVPFELWS
jgi:hypothetical protein